MLDQNGKTKTEISMSTLTQGIAVSVNGESEGLRERLTISSGCQKTTSPGFSNTALLANDDWRPLTETELETLQKSSLGVSSPGKSTTQITTWTLPPEISNYFDGFRRAIHKHNDSQVVANLFDHPKYIQGRLEVMKACKKAKISDGHRILGHYQRLPGLLSGSVNHLDEFIGLHVDSWNDVALTSRDGYPMRLSVNLGPEPRYLQFVNVTIPQIIKIYGGSLGDNVNDITVNFLSRFPNYPILKLRINPGESYIAPTEIIIHDATTKDKKYIDASFAVFGEFCPITVENLQRMNNQANI